MNYHWHWSVFLQEPMPGTTYLDWLLSGLELTLTIGLGGWLIALVLGTFLGVLRTLPGRLASGLAVAYVELFRNVPLLVQLFMWYFVAPEFLPGDLGQRVKALNPLMQQLLAAILCLGMFTAARICEQVRAGIESVSGGQALAGLALGLTRVQTYRFVILPVALRIILPPLTSEFMTIFKNSAVASMIGLLELAAQGRQLVDYTSQPYESFLAVTLLYLAVNMGALATMRWVERRSRIPGLLGTRER
ncbi:MAG: amino acid ABC transporter permease [Burkholderiales bacterium]|nr:amino acid ABC transporter permease [Burkholderiales bacterium]MCE7876137.1 amino acid ABC transporter permease [Betaproteobacteria bacterium PRO3]